MPSVRSAPTPPAEASALAPYAPMLQRYLFVLGGRGDRIDDLVQEVFVLALQKELPPDEPGRRAAFLRGVARNLLLRDRRSEAARREIEIADEVWQRQCDDGDGEDRLAALRNCVAALPRKSRELLQRCYADGAGRAELGGEFGLAPDGVKTTLRRLREGLRHCIERRLRGSS